MNSRGLLNWFLSPSFDHYNMSPFDVVNVARMICNEGIRQSPLVSNNDYERIHVSESDMQIYKKSNFLKPVYEIYNILNDISSKYIRHFLLHGSLADLKYIRGWSDLDTWVVIDDKIFDSPSALVELRNLFSRLNKFLLKIDPIAHHGFIIILESDLENYCESLLPIEVIGMSLNLYGPAEICIRKPNPSIDWKKKLQEIKNVFVEFDSSGIFRHHAYMGKYITKDMIKKNDGMYQFKYLIGLVMLLPSIYYTAIGKPTYKPESFEPFLKIFPISSVIIECVSGIRTDWEKMEQYPYVPNRIPSWLIDRLPSDYIDQIIQLLDNMIDDIS